MSKILVVYWSGTGNTQMMAEAVGEGAKGAGAEVQLAEINASAVPLVGEYDHVAFGCPSMGEEVLEEDDVEPFFTQVEGGLSGKKVALFGSYDWGDGQWMRDWEKRAKDAGAELCNGEGVIANLTPDESALSLCKTLGASLAAM